MGKKKPNFWHGVILGLLLGILSNLLITSLYQWVGDIPRSYNQAVFVVSAASLTVTGILMWRLAQRS